MSTSEVPREVIDFFLDPASYDHPVDTVVHRQTHVSHLFFAGDYVYKVKKPVDLGFLDFTSLEKRRAASVAEVELNRRVAPDIYLDLVAVHRDGDGGLSFEAPTRVEEVAVKMRRLPESWRLSRMIEEGTAEPELMVKIGRRVAEFHERAERSPEIDRYGSLDVIRHNWEENFEQTEPFVDRTIPRDAFESSRTEIRRFMDAYTDLFERRVDEGRIRDCHGDLQTDDIFIDDQTGTPYVLDCIEFNDRFRYSDTLSDIAFLSMDLRYRDAEPLAETLLDAYFESSGDERIPALLRFYESYRAYVRGKVRSFVLDQSGPSSHEKGEAADDARRFFELAVREALRLRPRVVLVGGLMGTGKTTLSRALSRESGTRALHSDFVRKSLAGIDPATEQKVAFRTGIYAPEWTERTYSALVDAARHELARGASVILDASWSDPRHREWARDAAAERDAIFAIVECTAPDEKLRARLARSGRQVTDGRLELLESQREVYEPPSEDEADHVIRADTSGDPRALAERVREELFGAPTP